MPDQDPIQNYQVDLKCLLDTLQDSIGKIRRYKSYILKEVGHCMVTIGTFQDQK